MPTLFEHLKAKSNSKNLQSGGSRSHIERERQVVHEWLGSSEPGRGEIKLNQSKKEELWNECSGTTASDLITIEDALTQEECTALINIWRGEYEGVGAVDPTKQLDSVDGRYNSKHYNSNVIAPSHSSHYLYFFSFG
jgi:hypothetical protein